MGRFVFNWPIGERQIIHQVLKVYSYGLKDLREVWDRFIPNLRVSLKNNFESMRSPQGEVWAPLSPEYARRKGLSRKTRKTGGAPYSTFKPVLQDTGQLFRAATRKGAPGQFIEIQPLGFSYSVERMRGSFNVGAIHQMGGRHMPRRTWLGLTLPRDLYNLQAQVLAYFKRLKGEATAIGRGRA